MILIHAERADDGVTFMETEGLPTDRFEAILAVPCPLGAVTTGGIGGAAMTACSVCGDVAPSTAGQPHKGPMLIPIMALVAEIGDRPAVMWRRTQPGEYDDPTED